jgi:hypothetical protein
VRPTLKRALAGACAGYLAAGLVVSTTTAGMYEELCGRGDGDNCYTLVLMYRSGQGMAQNRGRSLRLLEQSCKAGSPQGCEAVKQARFGS